MLTFADMRKSAVASVGTIERTKSRSKFTWWNTFPCAVTWALEDGFIVNVLSWFGGIVWVSEYSVPAEFWTLLWVPVKRAVTWRDVFTLGNTKFPLASVRTVPTELVTSM